MAQFKLNLLTSIINSTGDVVKYLETPISEFYDQLEVAQSKQKYNLDSRNGWSNRKHVYCYTFDENVSFHTNGQKELSFSMLRDIWLDNELTINPFVSKIKNGSQILLIDKYDNEYMFTVKDIKHTLNSNNVTYQYSCEDTFNYQHIRQHSGYSIENNATEEDFIGSKTVDWWVVNKIKKDCHISYEYVPFSKGIYQSKQNNNLTVFDAYSSLNNVLKIIKPIYTQQEYPELYEKIPFSISGSNAAAALISLAEELDLMLNYREQNIRDKDGKRTNLFIRYFWFEPKHNEKTANLKYSPQVNIQSFDFSHNGAALTTILNVEATEFEDESVTLIPSIPPFFSTLFMSNTWDNSQYTEGYFTSICQEKTFFCEESLSTNNQFGYQVDLQDSYSKGKSFYTNEYVYLCLTNNSDGSFKIPDYYEKVVLFNDKKTTSLFINNQYYSAKNSKIEFVILEKNNDEELFTVYNNTFNPLTKELLGTSKECYIRIRVDLASRPVIKDSKILLSFNRDATSEELEFAKMADLCPWLENKLIDFSYFLKQGVLSTAEYKMLLNTFKNDLRIINGKLLYYSKEYYRSIQEKTKQLANITTTLDSLGAAFNSDIVEVFKTTGKINDIDYFREAYRTYQTKFNKEAIATPILNYNELLSDYFNKYFKAQQRFLKNIYYFRQFFNQKIQWGEGVNVTKKTLTFKNLIDFGLNESGEPINNANETIEQIDNNTYLRRYISFGKKPSFSTVTSSFSLYDDSTFNVPVKIYLKDRISEAVVVTKNNCEQFFTNVINEGEMVRCSAEDGYDTSKTYYRVSYRGSLKELAIEDWPIVLIDKNENKWYQHHYDSDNVWYCSALPDSVWGTNEKPWPEFIEKDSLILNKDFIHVSYKRIINDYIYKNLYKNNEIKWQIHDSSTDVSVSNWWSDQKINEQLSLFHPTVFGNAFSQKDWENTSFKQLIHKIKTFFTKHDNNEESDERVNFYKAHFPITSIKYTGPNYSKNEYTWNNKVYDYQPANKTNQTFTDYLNYLKKTIVDKNTNIAEVISPFNKNQYVSRSIPIAVAETESKYFRRVPKIGSVAIAGAAVVLSGIWTVIPTTPLALGALSTWAVAQSIWNADTKWETSGVNTKDFYGNVFDEDMHYTGYHDSSSIFYTNSSSSFNDWKAITEQRKRNSNEISDVTISHANSLTGWSKSSISYKAEDNTEYYVYFKSRAYKDIMNDYFDYYSKIVFTYSSARTAQLNREKTLTYKDGYLRFVDPTETINKKNKYKVLLLQDLDNKDVIFIDNKSLLQSEGKLQFDESGRLSRVLYYFIDNNCSDVDLYDINIEETPSWDKYLKNYTYNDCIYSIKNSSNKTIQFVLFQQEDFNRKIIYQSSLWDGDLIKNDSRYSFYDGDAVYDEEDIEINFEIQADLAEGFYRVAEGDEKFIPIQKDTVVWKSSDTIPSTKFFKEENGEYVRVYSILQMMDLGNFYYINNDTYSEDTLSNVYDFAVQIYLHQEKYVKKVENNITSWILDSTSENTFIKEKHFVFNFFDNETKEEKKSIVFEVEDLNGLKYTRQCDLDYPEGTPIGNISNGHFWYLYHSAINQPLLFETAAAIETELTQYWEQAHSASLYCEYFLPSSWQPQSDGDANYFSNNIITTVLDGNQSVTPILSNKYIPEVSIFNNGHTSRIPSYQLKYRPDYDSSYSSDSDYQFINENHNTPAKDILSDHFAFKDAFKELDESMDNYVINNYNTDLNNLVKTTYYYSSNPNSGTKWKNFIQTHSSIPYNFEDYNGLYVMTYKVLKQQFTDKASLNYHAYKERQNILWDNLYKKYPGILLEDSYSNENATTSSDLYVLAKNAFKDKQEPERGYSISLIDAYNSLLINTKTDNNIKNWTRYLGQELKIGEGILIDVEEYYSDYDDIYKSLSQYLFITDISYGLRKDSDIQITVNTIKYQDKLIQRLVKLIK